MPVDPQIQALLDMGAGVPATNTLSVAQARAQYEGRIRLMAQPATVETVRERVIQGPGGDLRLRIYRPPGDGPFPLLAFFHGSGFVLCSLNTHDGMCRNLCGGAGCVVVSVDYRLAPEHKYPAGLDDCVFATRGIADHAGELEGDAQRLVVGGDSAGGNLGTVVALRSRDEQGPEIALQVLVYPVTDLSTFDTPSYEEFAEDHRLTKAAMEWFRCHYLRREEDGRNPHASPLLAPDLSGLPPALVITAECDPLRDEGEAYAKRLEQAGVPVTCTRYEGMIHPFFSLSGAIPRGLDAIQQVADAVRAAGVQVL